MEFISSTEKMPHAWWAMRCDNNHAWWRFLPGYAEPTNQDLVCPVDGAVAVTCGKRHLADRAVLRLIPATWEFEGAVGFENDYFIEISDPSGRRVLRSGRAFDFDEACKRLGWFRGIAWSDAERRWDRSGMRKQDPLKQAPRAGMEEV
jgi:hypothetical protein